MNTRILTASCVLGVIAVSVALPVSATALAITFTLAGTLAVLSSDYDREIPPVRTSAKTIPFPPAHPATQLSEAA
jgi:hypothetical protein